MEQSTSYSSKKVAGVTVPGSITRGQTPTIAVDMGLDKDLKSITQQVADFKTSHDGDSPLQVDAAGYNNGKGAMGFTLAAGAAVNLLLTGGKSAGGFVVTVIGTALGLMPDGNPEHNSYSLKVR